MFIFQSSMGGGLIPEPPSPRAYVTAHEYITLTRRKWEKGNGGLVIVNKYEFKGIRLTDNIKLRGTATKKSDAFALIYLRYLQHYKDTANVFGSTLTLVRYFLKQS